VTPGAYLKLRREAADVSEAEAFAVVPSIREIEANQASLTITDLVKLEALFSFDARVLLDLAAEFPAEICRECGCSEADPCEPPCWWAAPELCSACDEAPQ
jgi:hypothetical protein